MEFTVHSGGKQVGETRSVPARDPSMTPEMFTERLSRRFQNLPGLSFEPVDSTAAQDDVVVSMAEYRAARSSQPDAPDAS